MRGRGIEVRQQGLRVLLSLAVAAAALGAGGCSRAGADGSAVASARGAAPRHGGTLVVSLAKEPPIINPWLAPGAMAVTSSLVDGLNDPIVTMDDRGHWRPILATRVPTTANGDVRLGAAATGGAAMTITVNLRREARWSDGVAVSCDDIAFTWRTVMNPRNQMSNRLGWDQVAGIECPSPKRAVISMKSQYALYLSRILAFGPLPAHELRGKDFNAYWNDHVTVSSGPFLFESWQRGVRLSMRRNPTYWNRGKERRPYLDRVVFRFVKDANTLKMQLRMTEADVAVLPSDTNLVEELEATPDIEYRVLPGAVFEQLILQTRRPPMNDVRVRRALAYAVDRKMITDVVLKGQVEPLDTGFVPGSDAWRTDAFAHYRPDPAKVAKLLEAAGWRRDGDGPWTRRGKDLRLKYVVAAGSMPFRTRLAQLLQQQLARQGIRMDIELITPEVLYTQVAPKGNFHIGEWSELTGIEPAPSVLYGCDQVPRKPQWAGKNRYRWCDRATDRLIRKADATVDPVRRAAIVREIDRRVAAAAPLIPLFQSPDTIAWHRRTGGIRPNAPSGHTWNMDEWWVAG